MFRALFFLAGLFLMLQGGITLAVAEITLQDWAIARLAAADIPVGSRIALPVWLAPTLVATGLVTLVYAFALPGKKRGEE